MKSTKFSSLLLGTMVFTVVACSPKIKTSIHHTNAVALAVDAPVVVFAVKDAVPDFLENIGGISLGDTGFTTKCSYEIVIEKAKSEARKLGANVIKITEHKRPGFASTCHRIEALLYFTKDIETLPSKNQKEPLLLNTDYALLHVYRYAGAGPLISYNLKFGDSTLCKVRNNFKTTLKITEQGLNRLWAKTESTAELPIDIVHGKQYYLRCGVKMGAFMGRPEIEFVDPITGKTEFESFEAKHTHPIKVE